MNERIFSLRLLSFLLITLERFYLWFGRVIPWCLLFIALWLFGVPAALGTFFSVLVVIIFVAGCLYFAKHDVIHFRLPSLRDIDRRIETDSDVKNRPLSGFKDRLANDDNDEVRALWGKSRARLKTVLPDLKAPRFRSHLFNDDPYALRFLTLMLFGFALIMAGAESFSRLKDGLAPLSFDVPKKEAVEPFNIVIIPPEYTGKPQVILSSRTIQGEMLNIPSGSVIKVVVNGGVRTPKLSIGQDEYAFNDAFETQVKAQDEPASLVLNYGFFKRATWPISVIEDTPPTLSLLSDKPEVLEDGTVSFSLSVSDDYGVQYIDAVMALDDVVPAQEMGAAVKIRRSVVSPDGEDFAIAPIYDFTAHPWAGLPATITFTALDETEQMASLPPLSFTLPEREFRHPVAKTLVELRKQLSWNPLDQDTYDKVAYATYILTGAKELLHNDIVVYMAIRSAALRLKYNETTVEITQSVMDLMWDTALRVEDGDLSLTARRLRDTQAALERALQNPDISDEEISALMQDMREAMAQYLQELAREMQKRMAEGQPMPPMMDPSSAMNQNALGDFMDQMEQMMRDGEISSAQEMLSQMQRLMDMMNPSMRAQMPPDMQMMQQGLSELQKLIESQEALLGQTEKQADLMETLQGLGLDQRQNRAPNSEGTAPPFVNTEANQVEQEALRFILGKLMKEASEVLGDIPEGMGLAELEMRGSSEALGYNAPLESIPFQMRAIEYLKDSQEQLSQQLQQRMVQMTGFMLSFGQPQRLDPLGRPMGPEDGMRGDPNGDRVKIPDEAEQRRVQEILKLLRSRAGDGSRPLVDLRFHILP